MRLTCPAKLNRFLAVLGRRQDGFHELELVTTVLDQCLELQDVLEGETSDTFSLTLTGPTSTGLLADESNLVVKAWRLLEKEAGRTLNAHLKLEKRIPHGAGLGGGSSNAAQTLRLGNDLFELGLSQGRLLELAAELGSDVPLFVLGGTVLGLDRGERVFPLEPIPLEPLILVHPGLHVSTPGVYKALAQAGYPPVSPCPSLGRHGTPPWRNDLTQAAMFVCPELRNVQKAILDAGGDPLLCGSGSCWAGRFKSASDRDGALKHVQEKHPEWSVWAVG